MEIDNIISQDNKIIDLPKLQGSKESTYEFLYNLNIDKDKIPLLNGCSKNAIEIIGKFLPSYFNSIQGKTEEVKRIEKINQLKEDFFKNDKISSDLPKYFIMDQLFNLIDKLKDDDVQEETNPSIKEINELVMQVKSPQERIIMDSSNKSIELNKPCKHSLNQILFGPPGTGKTYNTINKAIAIANPSFDLAQPRDKIKKEFDRLMKEGQIVFTTFHQSMNYEDFIEGIKPLKPNENGAVTYDVKPGIFKELCQAAVTPNQVDFNAAYEQLKIDLSNNKMINLKTPTGKEFSISLNSNDNLSLHTGSSKEKQGTLTKENIQKQINGEERFIGWEGYFKGVLEYLKTKYKYSFIPKNTNQNFVLIIDEINRGNVSQIFGELITLIEEDKRLGKAEALKATLPYSKEKFYVPHNLYIIGTMNTADRSVEALDAALRRRFSFEEMTPRYNLDELEYEFAGIKASKLLETINNRIEKLLDKDHKIGHSYFMLKDEKKAEDKMQSAFYKNIIPLLQEYFFGDYGKIGLVLGEGFVRLKAWDKGKNQDSFAKFDYESDFEGRDVYEIIDYRTLNETYSIKVTHADKKEIDVEMDFKKAIKLLMTQEIE